MEIKKMDLVDIRTILDLVEKVFRAFECFDYDEEGIRTFEKYIDFDAMVERMNDGSIVFLGSYTQGQLTGVLGYDPKMNHISLFFVDHDYQGHGQGKELMQTYLEECKAKGVNKITANSSPFAVEIYKKYGFQQVDEEQVKDGIRYTPMEYILSSPYLGETVTVFIDRPYGSYHPYYPDTLYTLNYGYVENEIAGDGEFQDAYVYGVSEVLETFTGIVIAIIHRKNDVETKWVVAKDRHFNKQDVIDAVGFVEQYFDTYFEWLD